MSRLKPNGRVKILAFHGCQEADLVGAEGFVRGLIGGEYGYANSIAVQLDDNKLNFWPNGVGHIEQPCTLFVPDELEVINEGEVTQ